MGKKVAVKVRKPSGFDKSFQNIFTAKPGTIVPILVDELMPNSRVHLKTAIQASMPPLAFDTFMRVSLKVQAFFVPTRLLVASFEDYFTRQKRIVGLSTYEPAMPYCFIDPDRYSGDDSFLEADWPIHLGNGSLADFLGIRGSDFPNSGTIVPPSGYKFSLLPFIAYHRIYDDWFRNPLVQKPVFSYPSQSTYLANDAASLIHCYFNTTNAEYVLADDAWSYPDFVLNDGHNLFDLRQANFPDDLFTLGQPSGMQASSSVTIASNKFTVPALRMANAMQLYAELQNLSGPRFQDNLRAEYNASLSNGIAQRTLVLGSDEFEVYSKGIYQTNANAGSYANPFSSTGARYGDAVASGSGTLVEDFTAEEPGYLFVMAELIPRVTYSTGMAPHMMRYCDGTGAGIGDMANPIFEGIGNQAIPTAWLQPYVPAGNPQIFAYGERFCDWKTRVDELHGLVRDGESLQAMVLQRSFGSSPYGITDAWLRIPTNFFDQVTAVNAEVSEYGYWCDAFFKYHVSMPLKPYALPCLEEVDEEHQDTAYVDVSGSKIS